MQDSASAGLHFTTQDGKTYDILGLTCDGRVHLRHEDRQWTTSWHQLAQCLQGLGVPIRDRWMQGGGFATTTTYLTAQDFANGTYRITQPGFYVLCEDVRFLPHAVSPYPRDAEYAHPAYSMGFFAAITIECPGVVLDLGGHTISQSLLHYARMRFFDTIELANAPFISNQGPGSLNQSASIASTSHCVIQNGTLGLSSHAHIHGNANTCVEIRNISFQDFEVAAIQLNGPKHVHLEGLHMRALQTVPLDARLYSFHVHLERLQRRTAQLPQLAGLVERMEAVQRQLLAPFELTYPGKTPAQALEAIYAFLQQHTRGDARFFVNRTGKADGSAIYGIVIWCLGVSIGALRQACVERADGADAASRAQHVTIENVTIEGLELHARESVSRLDAQGNPLADMTGAHIEYHLETPCVPTVWTIARRVLLWLEGEDNAATQAALRALSKRRDIRCSGWTRGTRVAANEVDPIDSRRTLNFGGADARAIFINNSTRVHMQYVTIEDVVSQHSVSRGIEIDRVAQEDANATTLHHAKVCQLRGICRSAVYVQAGCSNVQLEDVFCDADSNNNAEILVQELLQLLGDVTPAVPVTTLRNVISRFVCDPSLLVVETQGAEKRVEKLCLSSSPS